MKKLIKKYEEIIRYLIVGVLTTIVSLGTYYLFTSTVLNPKVQIELQIANILAWIFSVTFAYFTNRKYVFMKKDKASIKEATSFYTSRISTLLLDMLFMFIFVSILKFPDKIIKIIVQFIIVILNYIFSKLLVFKNK